MVLGAVIFLTAVITQERGKAKKGGKGKGGLSYEMGGGEEQGEGGGEKLEEELEELEV
jgi:hypothetical protein